MSERIIDLGQGILIKNQMYEGDPGKPQIWKNPSVCPYMAKHSRHVLSQ
jgi:hypothetical protein